jgi:hypothetical protein
VGIITKVGQLADKRGNIQSLSADFGYDDKQSRALSVRNAGILEALKKVCEVPALVSELTQGHR